MLTFSDLTYRIAGRTLLDRASAQVNAGWKVALIGRNGAGKSTLLDLIRGELQPDGGEIRLQSGVRLGFLAQEAPGGDATPLETVLAADEERARLLAAAEEGAEGADAAEIHERLLALSAHAAPARAAGILAGLGFDHEEQQRPLSAFPAAGACAWRWPRRSSPSPICCCSTSPPTISTSRPRCGSPNSCAAIAARCILVSHDRDFLDEVGRSHPPPLRAQAHASTAAATRHSCAPAASALARQQALASKQEAAAQASAGLRRPLPRQGDQGEPGAEPAQDAGRLSR